VKIDRVNITQALADQHPPLAPPPQAIDHIPLPAVKIRQDRRIGGIAQVERQQAVAPGVDHDEPVEHDEPVAEPPDLERPDVARRAGSP